MTEGLAGLRARVFLIGSRARGEGGRGSDIDVAILPIDALPPGLLLDIQERLDNSEILYPVDLVDLSRADESFRDAVLREGVAWTS